MFTFLGGLGGRQPHRKVHCSRMCTYSGYLKAIWRDLFAAAKWLWALELVCGADFSWTLMCGAGPANLGGSRGSASAENHGKIGPKKLEPDRLQVPSYFADTGSAIKAPV